MEQKVFSILHLSRLKIDDLFALNKSTIGYADLVKENIGEMPNAILFKLTADNQAMEQQMNKALKNVLTPQLVEMNADRADRFFEIRCNVTIALKGRDLGKKTAAENVKIFLELYWDLHKKAMNTRTVILFEMFGKYNPNMELKAHAATIGITQMMTELEASNSSFNQVYQNRLMQEAAADGPSATSLRAAATKSYEQFCTVIELAANFTPSGVFVTLFGQMEELRKTYARLASVEEPEPEPEPEAEPSPAQA